MAANYWNRVTRSRINRRRMLIATGLTSASAAFLAACGSDDEPGAVNGTGSTGSTGGTATGGNEMLTTPVDETDKAQHGGIQVEASRRLTSLDPIGSSAIGINYRMYSTLWKKKEGHLEGFDGEMIGDIFESWEVSGDQMQVTGKVSPKAHFQGPAGSPVNGRTVDAHDVVYTWERFKEVGAIRSEVVNEVDPNSPVVSMTAADDRTVVINLSQPNAMLFGLLAQQRAGNFYVLPREAEDIDIDNTSIGSGAWVLDDWRPGEGAFLKRNPGYNQDWRGEDLPYFDELHMPELQETALALAQFKAGNILPWSTYIPQDQVLPLYKETPGLLMYRSLLPVNTSMRLIMGNLPESPFVDERVRQAAVKLLDKDLLIETLGDTAQFEAEGLPVVKTWDSAMAVNQPGVWFLDPQGEEFGENAHFYTFDMDEAVKLLSAAGYPDGVDTTMHATFQYNPGILNKMDAILAVFGGGQGGPIRYEINEIDYHTDWSPQIRYGKGEINGVAMLQDVDTPDPALYLYSRYHPSGGVFQGGDATTEEILDRAKAEFDNEARKELVYELQRYEGKMQHFPFTHGGASQFELYWPALRNVHVWQGGNAGMEEVPLWIDTTRPPFV